jgi:hypothetical protein
MRTRSALLRLLGVAWCALLLACATTGRRAPHGIQFENAGEQFKYGSVGIESEEGIPYWIWQVLPRLFADKLPAPGGYASFGFLWEPGRELPVGFSRTELLGGPRVAINCAFCHTSAFRTEPAGQRTLVPGGPAHQLNPQAYVRFLHSVAADPRFNAGEILAAISGLTRLSWMQRMQYRWLLIPATRKGLQRQQRKYAWMDRNPDWGPGRIDPFNPVKFGILKQPVDQTIGNADMIPIWNMKARRGMALHWDGLTTSLHESVLSSAIGDGASRKSLELANLSRIERWLEELAPPAYPFTVDRAAADRGRAVYDQQCAQCHAAGGARTGSVIPVEEVGTDRHRLDMWTQASAAAYNGFADSYPWGFKGFRKTNGYVAVPLDGVWLRAPYLHNGSVPSLEELLEPPDRRRASFYRGYDLYDRNRTGFVSEGEAARRAGTLYDTQRPGNGNGGHLYGTQLSAADKRALIEFLKTF